MSTSPFFYQVFLDPITGNPASDGRLEIYVAGSSVLADVWSDEALSTPRANPLVFSGAGVCPQYFVSPGQALDYKAYTFDGRTINTSIGVIAGGASSLPVASTTTLGVVRIDGETITIDGNGVIRSVVQGGVGYPGSGASSEVHNGVTNPEEPSRASGASSFCANGTSDAMGPKSSAFGDVNIALGSQSFATGKSTAALADQAITSGQGTTASGVNSDAGGNDTVTSGAQSFSRGLHNLSAGYNSATLNEGNHAHYGQTVVGLYAVDDGISDNSRTTDQNLFKVGYGVDALNRADAFAVRENGDSYVAKRILRGIWDGYAEGPYVFTASPGASLLGNGTVLKGTRTLQNNKSDFALGERIVCEWNGIIASTGTAVNQFTDPFGGTLDCFAAGPTGTYLAKMTFRMTVVGFSGTDPILVREMRIDTWAFGAGAYSFQETRQAYYAGTFPASNEVTLLSPLTIQFGFSATAAAKPKQISFKAWRE